MKLYTEKKGFRGYIASGKISGNFIPQHVQNIIVRDYAEKNKLLFKLSASEYIMNNSTMILESLCKELKELDGIILYSMFQLPNDKKYRENFYIKVLDNKCSLHAAVENISLNKRDDIIKWEEILLLRNIISVKIDDLKNVIY